MGAWSFPMMKCETCGMMCKDDAEMRMHNDMMRMMMMHMMKCMEMGMHMPAEGKGMGMDAGMKKMM